MSDIEREAELAYDNAVMESGEEAHFEEWPEGCPACCRSCQQRMADRCADSGGHVWPADFTYGDSCYCGSAFLLKRDDGRIEVKS